MLPTFLVVALNCYHSASKKIVSASLKEHLPSDGKVARVYRRHLEFNKQITAKL